MVLVRIWMDCRHFFKKKYVLSKIDECSTATDVVKSVNIKGGLPRLWSMAKAETIQNVSRRQVS